MTGKTNVSRLLDVAGLRYVMHEYDKTVTDGESVARLLGEDPARVFKTLVTAANTREHFVFCIPVNRSLDLKKAAKAAGVKSVEMIPQKTLLPLTGYVHGGCSPVGMKKPFRTFLDRSAEPFDTICVSAGKVGFQAELDPRAGGVRQSDVRRSDGKRRMIKVVLIDVDNTLLDFDACARQSVKAAWDALGLDWTPSVFPVFKSVNDGLWRDIERKTLTRERLHFLRFRLVFERLGINADADAAEEIFVRELTVSDVKVEGAERLLAHLSSKYTVCVASNAPNARQMGRLTTAGLFGYIDRMFVSADIGHDKPSKEFFDACFAALAPVRPDETVIIGDSLSADIAGGRAYGLHTCWFNYDGLPARGDEAEWIVRSLDEIRTFL